MERGLFVSLLYDHMRLGRFQHDGASYLGWFDDGTVTDVTSAFDSFGDALTRPTDARNVDGERFDVDEVTYLPPTTSESAVFCAALNYEAHAEESDIDVPSSPLIFTKLPRTLVGHEQPINYHERVTNEIDYEAELAAVIGTPARHVTPENALGHVAGYTILNDTSARDLQFGLEVSDDDLLDWFSGKSMQATTPVGPYVVVNEIDDPQDLAIASRVNGETMQDDETGMMIRSVADLVSFVSSRVRLEPGDVIATGTPEGVGTFQDVELHPGDRVEIDIEGIGTLANTVEVADD